MTAASQLRTLGDRINWLSNNGHFGVALQRKVMERAAGIAPHNRPYVFDGVQDCWGYVRQVWNAILSDGTTHPEDYHPNSYDRGRWLGLSGGILTADAPNGDWKLITDVNALVPGDLLSTHQGHQWGDQWHGGIFAGKGTDGRFYQWDNSLGRNGAFYRLYNDQPDTADFRYYYKPLHDLLIKTTSPSGSKKAFKAANGQFVVAEGGGGREVLANRNAIGDWEKFELIQLGGNKVALKAANGQFVVAEGGGGREVMANRNVIGPWETFELIQLGGNRIALKAANGQYVVAEGGGGREVLANRSAIGPWETFEMLGL